jgi:hypothetical protein
MAVTPRIEQLPEVLRFLTVSCSGRSVNGKTSGEIGSENFQKVVPLLWGQARISWGIHGHPNGSFRGGRR